MGEQGSAAPGAATPRTLVAEPPGRKWYSVALVALFAGGAGAGFFAWSHLASLEARLVRFVVPGTVELALEEPGSYTIFHEPRSVVDGRYSVAENIAGMRARVVSASSGAALELGTPALNETYTLGGHTGFAVLMFDVPSPGRYRLSAGYNDGRDEPKAVLTVGHGFLHSIFTTVLGALAIGFAVALAIASVTYVKRRRARQRPAAASLTA